MPVDKKGHKTDLNSALDDPFFSCFFFFLNKLLVCSRSQTKLLPKWPSDHGSRLAFSYSLNFITSNDLIRRKLGELVI